MTRLRSNDINRVAADLIHYEAQLIERTGYSLRAIACRAGGIEEAQIMGSLTDLRTAVIPITGGEGIIGGFGDAVAGILLHMGSGAFVTRKTDVAGIAEAFEKKADVMMLADDERFVALHIRSGKIADNAVCTGRAFAAGLELMTGGLNGQAVLVIGCGPVGTSATESLIGMGAEVSVYDIQEEAARELAEKIGHTFNKKIETVKTLDTALDRHKLILDASPAGDIIHAQHITPETYVSAPGMPSGLNPEAETTIADRLLHDPLQLGVATMLIDAVKFHIELCE